MAKRVKRVEHERGWGWIARDRHGDEVVKEFRWTSRSIARDVAYGPEIMEAAEKAGATCSETAS